MILFSKCFVVFFGQIMERILLSSKKTGLHDDVLRILYLHMDPLLPLPRLRMLSVNDLNFLACIYFHFPIFSFGYCFFILSSSITYFPLVFQVLYHVLGVIPAYQASIGPALNELCLGLQPDEVAPVISLIFLSNCNLWCSFIVRIPHNMHFDRLYTEFMQKMFM